MSTPSRPIEISPYEILQEIGESSSGFVYKARDPLLERLVTLRVIPAGLAGGIESRRLFLRDARLACSLEHPNACRVYEIGETPDGGLFLVSAFSDKPALEARIHTGQGRMEWAVDLAFQVASGVAPAHELGLLHGRLRPGNVRVGEDGQVTVLDFGLSGLEERTWFSSMPPASGALAQDYTAPELIRGEAVSARSDVWSIGALLFALLRHQAPPRSPEPVKDAFEPGSASPELLRVLARALSSRPADRHAHAGELRDDLRRLLRPSMSASTIPGMLRTAGLPNVPKYRIREQLGRGGMGVVYKAEDLQLGRTLAIKFLTAELSADPNAKARFLQEARTASALDHPNVCTIFELGETDEQQLYLAMPCYEGETLKERLARGPLAIPEALDFALQTVRGLAKAHRQGIVHRDIKPANLMLTGDGLIKILDFGVAKLAGDVGLTRAGSAIGTPSYMAPEQILGEAVDGRTDLWAVGVVLYEMLAGHRPFPGDNPEAVRHAILAAEPEPLARFRADIPAALDQIVRRLLSRDPGQRPPSADALAVDLKALLTPLTASAPLSLAPPPEPPARRRSRRGALAAGGLLLALVLAGLFLWLRPEPGRKPDAPTRFTQITDTEGLEQFPSLSPDGNFFVYTRVEGNDEDVFLQRVGGGNPINLTADSDAKDTKPVYSPDGQWIAFRSDRDGGGIFLMGATGESVRRLTALGYDPAWSPDSRQVAYATEPVEADPTVRRTRSEIWTIEIATGRQEKVVEGGALQPSWSPDGRRLAYWGGFGYSSVRKALWTIPIQGGKPTVLLEERSYNWTPSWEPDGRSIDFLSDRSGSMNLWRIPVDPATGRRLGEPEPIPIPAQFVSHYSRSTDGTRLLYATEEAGGAVDRLNLTPAAEPEGPSVTIAGIKKKILSVAPSPDGRWLVLYVQSPQEDLFLMRSDGQGLRQLTDDLFHDRTPRWSPDGKWIYFYSDRNGRYEVWAIRPDGSDPRVVVTRKQGEVFNPVPSPDGRFLACRDFRGPVLVDLSRPLADREIPFQGPDLRNEIFVPRSWSPDMTWIAGTLHTGSTMLREGMGVYSSKLKSFERLPEDGIWPTLLGDGKTVLYLGGGQIRAWNRTTHKTSTVASPPDGYTFRFFAPSFDSRLLYAVRITSEGDIWLLEP